MLSPGNNGFSLHAGVSCEARQRGKRERLTYSPHIGTFLNRDTQNGMSSSTTNIGDALFTKTQQRVLGLLYGRPERSFYLNELVRLAGVGKGSVRRELEKFCEAGLLTLTRQGNQNHYQANSANPIQVIDRDVVSRYLPNTLLMLLILIEVFLSIEG
jgi:hypothetical protein